MARWTTRGARVTVKARERDDTVIRQAKPLLRSQSMSMKGRDGTQGRQIEATRRWSLNCRGEKRWRGRRLEGLESTQRRERADTVIRQAKPLVRSQSMSMKGRDGTQGRAIEATRRWSLNCRGEKRWRGRRLEGLESTQRQERADTVIRQAKPLVRSQSMGMKG